ncbi:hypothetical protein SpiGrapes_1537 [Sphaerochaeta pleomorpha str. Grapes]|uniref:Uncharacterized protein n=1 Tax=Sphaerochaeta pleomorpha (strain ATCC BAA-1885 / DSM 22778 / Grapes) TaxID=158190 RepID=G8QVQ5_SPHPG|nr:hypothetical protein [Sphaerochaeta pleomorpha]AEV29347.1 hypothetical protein SpiGrapes_1537 [Sphaerochaeta pleomorpha str. Grapes]
MKKKLGYESLYRVNPLTNHVIIDIALDYYLEFFHEWDNAAFKKRDMHPDLAKFLDICSSDIPLRRSLDIMFCIKDGSIDTEKETLIIESFKNYFKSQERAEAKKLKRTLLFGSSLFLIAILLLLVYVIDKAQRQSGVLPALFLEGLLIGGWVFMWEALHMFFFESLEPFLRRKEIRRFLQASLLFRMSNV